MACVALIVAAGGQGKNDRYGQKGINTAKFASQPASQPAGVAPALVGRCALKRSMAQSEGLGCQARPTAGIGGMPGCKRVHPPNKESA